MAETHFRPEQSSNQMARNNSSSWSTWEFEHVEWSALEADGSAAMVPLAIEALVNSVSEDAAVSAYWRLDGTIVNEHRIFEAAPPAVRCLLAGFVHANAEGRLQILELLGQVGARSLQQDTEWNPDSRSKRACLFELALGAVLFFDALENGSDRELSLAVDLVYVVGSANVELRERSCSYLVRASMRECPEAVKRLIEDSLAELRTKSFSATSTSASPIGEPLSR